MSLHPQGVEIWTKRWYRSC